MNFKMPQSNAKSKTNIAQKNPLETLKDLGSSTVSSTKDEFKKIGGGMFDQFFGGGDYGYSEKGEANFRQEKVDNPQKKKEFRLFNYNEYYENTLIKKQIQELSELIRREIDMIKKGNASLLNEIYDIQKISVESMPDKVGIYHVRFLEIVLKILQTLRLKIGESKTWLQALASKKKKRGSLFMARSKKQGTAYSMSQELQNARSIQ